MNFGIDQLIQDRALLKKLRGRRVALLAHPASLTLDLNHSLDALASLPEIQLSAAFGPQHGLRGDKQDNMIESEDSFDPVLGIPIYSLYGKVRQPSEEMLESFDVILIDLQDLGCRIYTFITTLKYILEACAASGKSVWVLDRPNPAGRPVEGLRLRSGWESFVGAGPIPMRHGLTMGELGGWFVNHFHLDVDYRVVKMEAWRPEESPGYGWPVGARCWINPSPNAPNIGMVRAYAGTVLLEGTTLSEGRGTTRPLELFGAPDLDPQAIIKEMAHIEPSWLLGCRMRPCWFEPGFHKHQGKLCAGIQIHPESPWYDHPNFKPWRLQTLAFKAIRNLKPEYPIWRDFPYEYEFDRLAIDIINGSSILREWVDDPSAGPSDLETLARQDELSWEEERRPFLLY